MKDYTKPANRSINWSKINYERFDVKGNPKEQPLDLADRFLLLHSNPQSIGNKNESKRKKKQRSNALKKKITPQKKQQKNEYFAFAEYRAQFKEGQYTNEKKLLL